jgi:hypothetical protein
MLNQTAVGIVLVTAAFAAAAPAAATTGAATTNESGIAYLASGKSREDAAAMRHVARYYPLELEFARMAPGGKPADIDVMIKDRSGRMMLRAKVEGDLMLAQLPVGEYAVSATYNGVAIQKSVKVEQGRRHKLDFAWKN